MLLGLAYIFAANVIPKVEGFDKLLIALLLEKFSYVNIQPSAGGIPSMFIGSLR